MSAISNHPGRSALAQFTDTQLLIMLLTEARLQTRLMAQDMAFDEDLDQLRVVIMNDADFFADPQGATAG